jgi:pimeloyl-ACP methyl ester carboxylesterase
MVSRMVGIGNGVSLHTTTWGQHPNACLLLHGFGEGGYVWSHLVQDMSKTFTCIVPDFRGHGGSSWTSYTLYSTDVYVSDIAYLIRALGIRISTVIGHSMGGEVAIRLAAMGLMRFDRLVVVDFGPELNQAASLQLRADFAASLRPYGSIEEYVQQLEESRFLASSSMLRHIAENALRLCSDQQFRLKCDPALLDSDDSCNAAQQWELLKAISCPTLLVRGVGSAVLSRRIVNRMMQSLRNFTLAEVKMAGHAVMTDNPDGFAECVLPFVTGIA